MRIVIKIEMMNDIGICIETRMRLLIGNRIKIEIRIGMEIQMRIEVVGWDREGNGNWD